MKGIMSKHSWFKWSEDLLTLKFTYTIIMHFSLKLVNFWVKICQNMRYPEGGGGESRTSESLEWEREP